MGRIFAFITFYNSIVAYSLQDLKPADINGSLVGEELTGECEWKYMKYLKTFDKAKNKEVTCGYIDGDTYHRKVNNKHYMVKEKGYGIQSNIVNKLFSDRVKNVMIHTKTMDLKTTLNTWIIRGHRADYGNGEQVFLDTSFMEKL